MAEERKASRLRVSGGVYIYFTLCGLSGSVVRLIDETENPINETQGWSTDTWLACMAG